MKRGLSLLVVGALMVAVVPGISAAEDPLCWGLVPDIVGTPGPDILIGTRGDDVIWGGDGDDVIQGGLGDDVICGGRGADRLFGGRGDDRLFGQLGSDRIVDGGGSDRVVGGRGDDVFVAGEGPDIFRGGPGMDRVTHRAAPSGVTAHLSVAFPNTDGDTWEQCGGYTADYRYSGDGYRSIEWLVGSVHDDSLCGSHAPDRIDGGRGDDYVDGLAGDDVIRDVDGLDLLRGGDGDDLIRDLGPVPTVVASHPFWCRAGECDRVEGDLGDDRIVAGGSIRGGPGDDVIVGSLGPDVIWGGSGADSIYSQGGNDLVHADPGSGDYTEVGDEGPTADLVRGGAGNDLLTSRDGMDTLLGLGGDDLLVSSAAGSALIGGAGFDLCGYGSGAMCERPRGGGVAPVIVGHPAGFDWFRIDIVFRYEAEATAFVVFRIDDTRPDPVPVFMARAASAGWGFIEPLWMSDDGTFHAVLRMGLNSPFLEEVFPPGTNARYAVAAITPSGEMTALSQFRIPCYDGANGCPWLED